MPCYLIKSFDTVYLHRKDYKNRTILSDVLLVVGRDTCSDESRSFKLTV